MKKIIAIILAMLTLLSAMNIGVSANPVGFKESFDYSTNEWISNDELFILNKMSIMSWASAEDMGYRHNEVSSRWFAAWYVCNMAQLKKTKPQNFETLFKDLTSEHAYYAEIKAMVDAGYMKGYPDGNFRPNEPLSSKEFAEILLKVLGYEPYIKVYGIQRALNLTNIMDGVPETDALVQAQTLKMIYNAFNSPAIRTSGNITYKDGVAMLDVEIDETYLGFEHLRNVKHEVAVLDGVEGTTLNKATDGIKSGTVLIAGNEFRYSGAVNDFLGYRVNYFYKEATDGTKTIIHLFKNEKNDELKLNYDEIDSFKNGVYTYAEGNKTKEIVLDEDVKVIYNGIANPSFTDEEMIPDFGSVTFINNDSKRGYEVVKIENTEFYFSSSINATEFKIYDTKNKPNRMLDLKECDELAVYNGENEIAFERIKKSNLLAVKRSSANSGYDKATIETFKVANKAVKVISKKDETVSSVATDFAVWGKIVGNIEIGKVYNFYTYEGTVVMAIEDTEKGPEHMFLMNMGIDGNEFSKVSKFAVMDLDGNYAEYLGAERITVDDALLTPEGAKDALFASAQIGNGKNADYPYSQPMRVKFNSKGEINWIDTFAESENDDENSLKFDEKSVPVNTTSNGLRYSQYSESLYNSTEEKPTYYTTHIVSIDSATKVLFVPDERFEEDAYFAKDFSAGGNYLVDPIGMDELLRVADVVYVYYKPSQQALGTYTRQTLISDMRTELNEEGDAVYVIEGYYQNNLKTYTCDEELFKGMSVGDIYRFETDRKNHIATYAKLFSVKEGIPSRDNRQQLTNANPSSGLAGYTGTIFGTLIHAEGGFVRVCQALITDKEQPFDTEFKVDNFSLSSTSVYRYTTIQGQPVIEPASISDAIPYSLDPEHPSTLIVNVLNGTNQIIIYEP